MMATPFFRLALFIGLFCSSGMAWSQTLVPRPDPRFTASERKVRRWALIVGVGSYSREPSVRFAVNDTQLIESTLVTSGDFHRDQVLVLSDIQPPHLQPTLDNLNLQIPRWLENVGVDDVVFVYFSGHGDVDPQGNGVLCPTDFDRSNARKTGFALDRLRTLLVSCPSREKVLVLDCCHAGMDKAVGVRAKIDSGKLLTPFQGTPGLVTLASCRANELSYEDERQRQGVFTFQVAQALRGGADLNRDGIVDSEELFQWCSERVPPLVQKKYNADQHPERLRESREVIGISRTQFEPSVHQLVDRKENGVFRVECFGDQNWTARGSAFAIAYVKSKVFLVTSAGVVEDDEGRLRSNEKFRLQCGRLLSFLVQPSRILTHPQRRNGRGPDVAIIEVDWSAANPVPTMFNLRSPEETTDLRGRDCAILAFPNRQDIDSFTRPEYASGRIAMNHDGQQSRINYVTDYPNQADGAPLFVVDDRSERGGQLRESVIGITSSNRYGDNQLLAESTDVVWQIISDSTPQLGFSILPLQRKSRSHLKATEFPVRASPEPLPIQESAPPTTNWPEQIDRALKLAAQEGRGGHWDRGFAHLADIEAQLAREGMTASLPWEFYSLRGVLLTHRGFQQNESNNRSAAVQSFSEAWKDCNRGRLMAPDELYPQLMVGRIYNNLGTPSPGQAIGPQERIYLKWTHDQMQKLVNDDEKGIRRLEPKHLAQCQYLLGYVHQVVATHPVVGGKLCEAANGRGNFEKSWAAMHSKQVARMLQLQSLDSVDIWSEYDELLLVWERRRSTACKSCQVAQKCQTCN